MRLLFLYLIIINALAFIIMLWDKSNARARRKRVSEFTFFCFAFIGGAAGIWLGMYIARHKTRRWYFVVSMPLLTLLTAVVVYFLI